ncbi:MAG: hypothetical protein WA821_06915 [Anaerolineales bacterium]
MKDKRADLLSRAALAVNNSLSEPGIRDVVAAYGYTADKLREGSALVEAAQAASDAQLAADGGQQRATAALNEAAQATRAAYQALAKVARAACDKPSLTTLGLSGSAPQNNDGLMKAASSLFNNAPRIPALAGFGYDAEKLAAGRAAVAAMQTAAQQQDAAKGAAQKATLEQKAAFKALEAWLALYIKVAKVALVDDAQQLEKLGVVARTSPTAAQRAAASARKQQTPTTT